jgi:hypothetical protein
MKNVTYIFMKPLRLYFFLLRWHRDKWREANKQEASPPHVHCTARTCPYKYPDQMYKLPAHQRDSRLSPSLPLQRKRRPSARKPRNDPLSDFGPIRLSLNGEGSYHTRNTTHGLMTSVDVYFYSLCEERKRRNKKIDAIC